MSLTDGFTPLMLASFHGGGIDTGIEEADSCSGNSAESAGGFDGSTQIITDLISQGAGIHAQTDRTGTAQISLRVLTSLTILCLPQDSKYG